MDKSYNYPRYKMSLYDLGKFPGPTAGEEASDFALHRPDGSETKLSDYRGKWLVLETGSLTCPMYVRNVSAMAKLRARYPDVVFLVVYVREAHPGSRTGPHRSLDEKLARAKEAEEAYGETREILVDSVDGAMHLGYGGLPNMVYVVAPDGRVIYRCDWAFVDRIARVLASRDRINCDEHVQIFGAPPWIMVPVTLKGGWNALRDLLVAMPSIFLAHLKTDVAKFREKRIANAAKP